MKMQKIVLLMLVCLALAATGCSSGKKKEYNADDASHRKSFSTIFTEGHYECGFVIDEGEYVLLATEDDAYFSVSAAADSTDILCEGSFSGNSLVTLSKGETIVLEKCIAVPSGDFYAAYRNNRSADGVLLKAGEDFDIKPGEYRLAAAGEGAAYTVFTGEAHGDVRESGAVDGECSVKLSDGEYLLLEGCTIK